MKVLIVDDSELMRERLAFLLLELEGIDIVGETGSAQTALEWIGTLHPDTVILDIRLSGGNGLDIVKRVKGLPSPPRTIVFTNYPELPYRQAAISSGADYFFRKGKDIDSLIQALKISTS